MIAVWLASTEVVVIVAGAVAAKLNLPSPPGRHRMPVGRVGRHGD